MTLVQCWSILQIHDPMGTLAPQNRPSSPELSQTLLLPTGLSSPRQQDDSNPELNRTSCTATLPWPRVEETFPSSQPSPPQLILTSLCKLRPSSTSFFSTWLEGGSPSSSRCKLLPKHLNTLVLGGQLEG